LSSIGGGDDHGREPAADNLPEHRQAGEGRETDAKREGRQVRQQQAWSDFVVPWEHGVGRELDRQPCLPRQPVEGPPPRLLPAQQVDPTVASSRQRRQQVIGGQHVRHAGQTLRQVGCGGTGGCLAEAIRRLLIGRPERLYLVGPDRVEPHNVARP
jgi:hypothetical protein